MRMLILRKAFFAGRSCQLRGTSSKLDCVCVCVCLIPSAPNLKIEKGHKVKSVNMMLAMFLIEE